MGILDDHNPYPGLESVKPLTGDQTREARVWSILGLACALLWLGGALSIAAIVMGVLARMQLTESGRSPWFRRLATLDILLGIAGIGLAIYWFVG